MKAPLSWLKDYVDIDVSAQELAEKLFSCGFEVEELSYLGNAVDRVVVGQVKSVARPPRQRPYENMRRGLRRGVRAGTADRHGRAQRV